MSATPTPDPAPNPPKEEESIPTSPRPARRWWRWAKRLILLLVALIVVAGIAAWLGRDWIAARIRTVVDQRLDDRGLHVSYEVAGLNPIRGFMVRDLILFHDVEKTRPAIELTDLACLIQPLALLSRDREGLTLHLSSKDATLTLHRDDQAVTFEGIDARWEGSPDALKIHRFTTRFQGLDLDVEGAISLRQLSKKSEPPVPADEKKDEVVSVADTIDLTPMFAAAEWVRFQGKTAPDLKVEIDRDDSGKVTVEGEFSGKEFAWRDLPLDRAEVPFVFQSEGDAAAVEFKKAEFGVGGGDLSLTGKLDLPSRTLSVDLLKSTIDPWSLMAKVSPGAAAPAVRFVGAPTLTLESGVLPLNDFKKATLKGDVKSEG
ncbi:MAG: hypothetical protein KDM63_19900, partial [Verrucomicrobiae bacterium]|nr:hypothetical protein [Verrucomicrobiae bacterium]